MRMKIKRLTILSLLVFSFLLSGCWDQKDIEQRGYVLGIAIDAYPPTPIKSEGDNETLPEEEEYLEMMETHTGKPLYAMTIQLPIVRKSTLLADGGGGGSGSSGEASWEITQVGNSFISMNREMLSRTSLSLYYQHLQVVIISDRVARQGIGDVLDFFLRDPELRRRVRVFISKGEAKAVLDVTPRVEEYSSVYLSMLPINAVENSRVVHRTDLGEVIIDIHNGFGFVLPMAEPTKDEIKISGAAAFKDDKMVGWVSELEIEGIKLLRDIYMGGIVTIKPPQYDHAIVALEISKAKTQVNPVVKNDEVHFEVKIKVEGNYAENINMAVKNSTSQSFINNLEQEFERAILRNCEATLSKFQQEYKTDVFEFARLIQAREPAHWEKISDKWDVIFPTVDVEIDVDVDVVLTGLVE